jgi:hypothetical protein
MKAAKAKKAQKKRARTKATIAMLNKLEGEFKGKKAKKKTKIEQWPWKGAGLAKIKTIHMTLPKGLTRKEALKVARKKHKGDHRGFTYNAKTGKATLT